MDNVNVIETRDAAREYGFKGKEAIVDHPSHGRLLIVDGFGGQDTLSGGAVRWRHGRVCKLLPDDSFRSLDAAWNAETSVQDAALAGYDSDRPLQEWTGNQLASLANACGL